MPNPTPGYTILEHGRLKPGLYKIQNLVSKTYVDIHQHSMELCCRPASSLEKDDGIVSTLVVLPFPCQTHLSQWEVLPLGGGYTIRMVAHRTLRAPADPLTRRHRNTPIMRENPTSSVR